MGIFSRMADIINANINVMLDKAEDPQKMICLIIQEMEETLVEVRSSSARVIADKKAVKRRLEHIQNEADDWEAKAKLALSKDREDLAKAALTEKYAVADEMAINESDLISLDEQLEQLTKEVDQLQKKLNDTKAKKKTLLMRAKTASNRLKIKRQIHHRTLDEAFAKFEHFERRVDSVEGQVESMDIGREIKSELAVEINNLANDDKINSELEKLKAVMLGKKNVGE
jgi:phage shock protein A